LAGSAMLKGAKRYKRLLVVLGGHEECIGYFFEVTKLLTISGYKKTCRLEACATD